MDLSFESCSSLVSAEIRDRGDRTRESGVPLPADFARLDRTKASIDIPAAQRNSIRDADRCWRS
jgi:hypothetical protein